MSLGILVGRFGQFVRDYNEDAPPVQAPEPDFALPQDVRETISHHIIPLVLLARADGNEDSGEQKAICDHAIAILAKAGKTISDAQADALKAYIANLRPSLMQLDPALRKLEKETPDAMIALLAAARAVVMADGRIDPAEARLLDELKLELAKV